MTAQHQRHSSFATGVKQGCVLAPTLFGIVFDVMSKQAFGTATEGIYFRTRSNGELFNISRPKAKTRVREVCLLFADDTAVAAHTEEELQQLHRRMRRFRPTISLTITQVMGQDVDVLPSICIRE